MFTDGFAKTAKEEKSNHYGRRYFLGNPIASAVHAKKGKKMLAYNEAAGHGLAETAKGGIAGGALGALAGAARYARHGKAGLKHGGKAGALIGAGAGIIAGSAKGQLDHKATEIYHKHAK
jgi:hypothetical protein